jgi:hypothetical protein
MRSNLSALSVSTFVQRASVLLVVIALLGAVGLALAGSAGAAPFDGGFEQMDVEPDDVSIAVAVEPDGDAAWTVEYRIQLATDEEEQAFEELRADVENDTEAYTSRFRERMASTATTAESATGRNMTVSNATVTAERRELPQTYGVLTYRFEWTNFAEVDGDRLRVGDAVDGLFLDGSSSFIVSWPEGYRLAGATPEPGEVRDRSVVWTGPVDFSAGQPRIEVAPSGPLSGLPTGALAALVVVLVAAGGGVAYRRRSAGAGGATGAAEPTPTATGDAAPSTGGGGGASDGDAAAAAGASAAAAGDDASDESASDGEDAATPDDSAGSDEAPPVDSELLSNEEQVLRLIESQGGRMKQKQVAEDLDWTAAKTSQVVTGLRDEGDLDGFRLGRENVLSLPDFDPEEAEGDGSGSDETEAAERREGESGRDDDSDETGPTGGD